MQKLSDPCRISDYHIPGIGISIEIWITSNDSHEVYNPNQEGGVLSLFMHLTFIATPFPGVRGRDTDSEGGC